MGTLRKREDQEALRLPLTDDQDEVYSTSVTPSHWLAHGLSYVDGGNGDFRWRLDLDFQIMYNQLFLYLSLILLSFFS